jgi:glucosylceramidase
MQQLSAVCMRKDGNSGNGQTTDSTGTIPVMLISGSPGDSSVLLQKQNTALVFGTTANSNPFIDVDSTQTFQTVDGLALRSPGEVLM